MAQQRKAATGRLAGIEPEREVQQLKKEEHSGLYDDIIDLPHPVSQKHPPMPMKNRAAQFSPFAALNGHGAAIREALRETESRRELGEYDREVLDRKLACLQEHLAERPEVTVTYFLPDSKKDGGRYADVSGKIKKIDFYHGILVMEDGTKIRLEDIFALSGRLFDSIFFDG